jgi:hypothetical protein
MSDTSKPAENLKLPTGKLGQPTTDTAIQRATDAAAASKAAAENGPQITRPAVDLVTPSVAADTAAAAQATVGQAALPLLDLFRGAARMSAENAQTLCDSWISLGRGVRDIQVQWLDTLGSAAGSAGFSPQLWQVQRDLYVQGLDRMFDATAQMITLATKPLTTEVAR